MHQALQWIVLDHVFCTNGSCWSSTLISRLSTHSCKHASKLSVQFFGQNQGSRWVCLCFAETSEMIFTIHHTFVQLPFKHRSEAIGRRCPGQLSVQNSHPSMRPSPDGCFKLIPYYTLNLMHPLPCRILSERQSIFTNTPRLMLALSTPLYPIRSKCKVTNIKDTTHLVLGLHPPTTLH